MRKLRYALVASLFAPALANAGEPVCFRMAASAAGGRVDMACLGVPNAPNELQVHNFGCLGAAEVTRLARVVQACHAETMKRAPALTGGLRIDLARDKGGPFLHRAIEFEGGSTEALTACITAGADKLALRSAQCTASLAHATFSYAPSTRSAGSAKKSMQDEADAVCAAATRLVREGARGSSDVLQRLASRYTESRPSPAGLEIMSALAHVPAAKFATTWETKLAAAGAKNATCAELHTLLDAAPAR